MPKPNKSRIEAKAAEKSGHSEEETTTLHAGSFATATFLKAYADNLRKQYPGLEKKEN